MNTKQYLSQIGVMKKRVRDFEERIDYMRSELTNISVKSDDMRVQSSSDPDTMANMIATILDRESELNILLGIYINTERTITKQIDAIENPSEREILVWKYVHGMSLEKIAANVIEKSWRHTARLHGRALKSFEKKFGDFYLMS